MDQSSFILLIEKYESGAATDKEKLLLEAYLDKLEQIGEPPIATAQTGQEIWEQLQQRISSSSPKIKKLYPWKQIAAAVALLTMVSGIWYYHTTTNQPTHKQVALADVLPAKGKAILTLANGEQVALGNSHQRVVLHDNDLQASADSNVITYSPHPVNDGPVQWNKLTVPRGGQYQLVLPDGTRVWLNVASEITYPVAFKGPAREVTVNGEAYFEIAQDARHPFIIHVNDTRINVLGTSVNIRNYESYTTTTLITGSVQVAYKETQVQLRPGFQAIANGTLQQRQVNTAAVLAWKNGYFSFENTSLKDVMEELSRWYDIDIKYNGDVNSIKYDGEIQRNLRLTSILKQLEQPGLQFKFKDNVLIVEVK
jgi:hypothetical protein